MLVVPVSKVSLVSPVWPIDVGRRVVVVPAPAKAELQMSVRLMIVRMVVDDRFDDRIVVRRLDNRLVAHLATSGDACSLGELLQRVLQAVVDR